MLWGRSGSLLPKGRHAKLEEHQSKQQGEGPRDEEVMLSMTDFEEGE